MFKLKGFTWRLGIITLLLVIFSSPTTIANAGSNQNLITLLFKGGYSRSSNCHSFGFVYPNDSDCAVDVVGPSQRNDPLYAPFDGVVTFRGDDDDIGNPYIAITGDRYMFIMIHGEYLFSMGDQVSAGQLIGYQSNIGYIQCYGEAAPSISRSGRDCGYHVHIAVKDLVSGQWIHPESAMTGESGAQAQPAADYSSAPAPIQEVPEYAGFSIQLPQARFEDFTPVETTESQEESTNQAEESDQQLIEFSIGEDTYTLTASDKLMYFIYQVTSFIKSHPKVFYGWMLVLIIHAGLSPALKKNKTTLFILIVMLYSIMGVYTSQLESFEIAGNAHAMKVAVPDESYWSSTLSLQTAQEAPSQANQAASEDQLGTFPIQGSLWGYIDRGVIADPPSNAIPIEIIASYYWPPMGGPNCFDFRSSWPSWANQWGGSALRELHENRNRYGNGYCWSATASRARWEDMAGYCIAMPSSIPFGTRLYAFGKEWEVCDRGGAIVEESGAFWVDFLHPVAPAPYGSSHQAYIVYP